MASSKYSKYILEDLTIPSQFSPEFNTWYNEHARRILWMDGDMVPGAFQLNVSWYFKPAVCLSESHVHDTDEVLGFFGSDPDDSHNLGGELEYWIEDEKFIITKSCLIFLPRGVRHCPQIITRVDRPIIHFGCVPTSQYKRLA